VKLRWTALPNLTFNPRVAIIERRYDRSISATDNMQLPNDQGQNLSVNKAQAKKLGEFFGISPVVFI